MASNDGRSAAFALLLAKAFKGAVPRPHLTTDVSKPLGYSGPASFEVAMVDEENGQPNGRFARVSIEISRDAERAEVVRRELGVSR